MQIDAAFIGIAVSLLVAVFSALSRLTLAAREREQDNRHRELKDKQQELQNHLREIGGQLEDVRHRISNEEKETIRQMGSIDLVKATHGDLKRDVEDIKSQMLTRAEFEPRMSSIEKSLSTLITELREMRGAMPNQ